MYLLSSCVSCISWTNRQKGKITDQKIIFFLLPVLWCPLFSCPEILVSFLWSSLPLHSLIPFCKSAACTIFHFSKIPYVCTVCVYYECWWWKKGTLWVVNVQRRCVTQIRPSCVCICSRLSPPSPFSDDRLSWIKSWTCILCLCLYVSLSCLNAVSRLNFGVIESQIANKMQMYVSAFSSNT